MKISKTKGSLPLERSEIQTILRDQEILFHKLRAEARQTTVRETFETLRSFVSGPHPVVISGLRRCGKSTLLMQLANALKVDSYYYLNFEDERLEGLQAKQLNLIYEVLLELYGERKIFLVDEIQNVEGWETWVRRSSDLGLKFIITGSNASLLSKELGTRLTGRYLPLELFPFSFGEYLRFEEHELAANLEHWTSPKFPLSSKETVSLLKAFKKYCHEGGIPAVLRYPELPLVSSIYQDILNRDVIVRRAISNSAAVFGLSRWLLNNPATLLTYSNLLEPLAIKNVTSIRNYISFLSDCYLFQEVALFSPSVRKTQINPKKVYPVDISFVQKLSIPHNERLGQILESQVFVALRRISNDVFYLKTSRGKEIDFYLPQHNLGVQVCMSFTRPETKARELEPLSELMSTPKNQLKAAVIVTLEEEDVIRIAGRPVPVVPAFKLLALTASNLEKFLSEPSKKGYML